MIGDGTHEGPPDVRPVSEATTEELLNYALNKLPMDQRMEVAPRIWLAAQEASAARMADPDDDEADAKFKQLWEAKSLVCEGFTPEQVMRVYEEAGRLHKNKDLPSAS